MASAQSAGSGPPKKRRDPARIAPAPNTESKRKYNRDSVFQASLERGLNSDCLKQHLPPSLVGQNNRARRIEEGDSYARCE